MRSVGGRRQNAAMRPRTISPPVPEPAHAVYTPEMSGMPQSNRRPMMPMPSSSAA